MVGSIALVAILGIIHAGGFGEVWNRAVEGGRIFPPKYVIFLCDLLRKCIFYRSSKINEHILIKLFSMSLDLTERVTFWNTIAAVFVGWTTHVSFNQNCAQRLITLPTLGHAKRFIFISLSLKGVSALSFYSRLFFRSMFIFFIGVILIMGINISTGIIMYSYYHGCDPVKAGIVAKADSLVPRFVQDVAGHIPGMSGIFISCVFSASLSTVSANLHAVAGVIYSDYVRPLKLFAHTDFNANLSMRTIIFLLGTICAFGGVLVEQFKSIFQVIITVSGITTGVNFGIFTLGMLYPWANQKVCCFDFKYSSRNFQFYFRFQIPLQIKNRFGLSK